MTSLVLQPVRVQAALAGLLGLLATLWCGWWLAAAGSGSTALQRSTLGPRALPKLPTGIDKPEMLQRERDSLLARKQTSESQTKKQTEELNRLSAKAATLQQQLKQAGTMRVDAIKKNPPKWDLLKHEKANKPEFDRLIVLWEGSTDAAAEQEAIRILATNQSHWETEASTAMGNAANLRNMQAADLQTMKTTFQAESDKKIASLSYEANIQGMANEILEAVKMLTGGTRASPGENFTNSAGIELVWVPESRVPESNFWIGKTEVTGKQYNFVINGAAEGSDEPKDGVGIAIAENYVSRLNDIEAADMQVSLDNKLKPPEFTYALPSVVQWNTAKSQRETLTLSGFETQPFEWTSSKNRDGKFRSFEQPSFYKRLIEPNHPVVIDDKGPITLEPTTTSSVSFKGMSKTVTKWSGRLGFRIILIRNQP